MLEQQMTMVELPLYILRNKMSDVYIGVDEGFPFVTDADEVYVFVEKLWYMCERNEIPDDIKGDVHKAVQWAVNEVISLKAV